MTVSPFISSLWKKKVRARNYSRLRSLISKPTKTAIFDIASTSSQIQKSRFCAHWSLPEGRYVGLKKLGVSIPSIDIKAIPYKNDEGSPVVLEMAQISRADGG